MHAFFLKKPKTNTTKTAHQQAIDDAIHHLLDAGKRLSDKGLTNQHSLLSLRVISPQNAYMVSISPTAQSKPLDELTAQDIGVWQLNDLKVVDPNTGKPANKTLSRQHKLPKQSMQALHARIFSKRMDVGGIFVSGGQFSQALSLVDKPMPAIFDEQVRQIGNGITTLRLKNNQLTRDAKKCLTNSDNAYLMSTQSSAKTIDEQVRPLILGITHERVVFNAELLEKCAKAYVLASATGKSVTQVPFYVRFIAHRRKLKDQAYAADCYQQGNLPTGFTAY